MLAAYEILAAFLASHRFDFFIQLNFGFQFSGNWKHCLQIKKLGGQQNYFHKMSVFNIQLDEIKNMNSVTTAFCHLLPLTTFMEVVLFYLKIVCL